jgi:hypothetical protein
MATEAYIYDAIRTPRGRGRNGALHGVKPISLIVGLLQAMQERNPKLDPGLIDDLILGCVTLLVTRAPISLVPQPWRRVSPTQWPVSSSTDSAPHADGACFVQRHRAVLAAWPAHPGTLPHHADLRGFPTNQLVENQIELR